VQQNTYRSGLDLVFFKPGTTELKYTVFQGLDFFVIIGKHTIHQCPVHYGRGTLVYRRGTINGSTKIESCDQHFLSTDGKTQVCLYQHTVVSF